jgi:hypothetical protein
MNNSVAAFVKLKRFATVYNTFDLKSMLFNCIRVIRCIFEQTIPLPTKAEVKTNNQIQSIKEFL